MAKKESPKEPAKRIKIKPGVLVEEEVGEKKDEQKESTKGEIGYEENKISSAEFEELEKKEGKDRANFSGKGKEESGKGRASGSTATDVDMLLLKTEKIEGKIESMAESRKATEERISSINQEIGELRSSILEKDRLIRDFQSGFTRIKEMAEGMHPDKITAQFAAKEEEIEKNAAAVESLGVQIKAVKEGVKANKKVLESVRGIEGVVNTLTNLKEKVDKVEEDRKFTSRTAGKIETMFSDLSSKLAEFQSYKDKIAFNEETMHEIMKTMDMVDTKLQETVKKDEQKKYEGGVDERFEKMETRLDDKLFEIRDMFDKLLNNLKEAGIKGVLETVGKTKLDKMFATKNDIEDVRKKLDVLKESTAHMVEEKAREFSRPAGKVMPDAPPRKRPVTRERAKEGPKPFGMPEGNSYKISQETPVPREEPVKGIKDQIDSMIESAEESIKMGNLDTAKNMYREALSMYNDLNKAESYDEAAGVYERIRRLYSRLRIYS